MTDGVLNDEEKRGVELVLIRAADDIVYREQLLKDPRATLQGSGLGDKEIEAIETLNRVGLEELGVNVRAFRSFLRDNGNGVAAIHPIMEAVRQQQGDAIPRLSDLEKQTVEEIFRKAASDPTYRDGLLANPRLALQASGLGEEAIRSLEQMNRVGMEELGVNVRPLRAFLRDNGNGAPMAFAIGAAGAKKP